MAPEAPAMVEIFFSGIFCRCDCLDFSALHTYVFVEFFVGAFSHRTSQNIGQAGCARAWLLIRLVCQNEINGGRPVWFFCGRNRVGRHC